MTCAQSIALLSVLALGCSNTSASGNDATETDGATDSTGTTTVMPGTMTGTASGSTTAEGTTSETDGSTGGPQSGTDTEGTTSSGTDTDGAHCADLRQADCEADVACMAVIGNLLEHQGQVWCIGAEEYLGCIPTQGCDAAITYVCPMMGNQTFQLPDGCFPEGFEICDPPAMPENPC